MLFLCTSAALARLRSLDSTIEANQVSFSPQVDAAAARCRNGVLVCFVHEWATVFGGHCVLPVPVLDTVVRSLDEELAAVVHRCVSLNTREREAECWEAVRASLGRPLVPDFSPFAFDVTQTCFMAFAYP